MKLLVCGGRDYSDRNAAYAVLDGIRNSVPHDSLIVLTGAASGADQLAWDWCASRSIHLHNFPAEWKKHGKAAGPMRNQKMLEEGPDLVVAFPGGRGTADMVRRAKAAGVPVREIR